MLTSDSTSPSKVSKSLTRSEAIVLIFVSAVTSALVAFEASFE